MQSHAEQSRLMTQLQASREELQTLQEGHARANGAMEKCGVLEEDVRAASAENTRLSGLLKGLTSEKAAAVGEAERLGTALRKLEESSQVIAPEQRCIAACLGFLPCLVHRSSACRTWEVSQKSSPCGSTRDQSSKLVCQSIFHN